jgi:hypothetical protein
MNIQLLDKLTKSYATGYTVTGWTGLNNDILSKIRPGGLYYVAGGGGTNKILKGGQLSPAPSPEPNPIPSPAPSPASLPDYSVGCTLPPTSPAYTRTNLDIIYNYLICYASNANIDNNYSFDNYYINWDAANPTGTQYFYVSRNYNFRNHLYLIVFPLRQILLRLICEIEQFDFLSYLELY